MVENSAGRVREIQIESELAGQRIDNFLMKICKGVPKSRVYKAIRKGEVRVNKKRVTADYRLQEEDRVRVPPFRQGEQPEIFVPSNRLSQLSETIIFENDDWLVLNKPAGIAVHGGSGVDYGVIEALRKARPHARVLELIHRLDRDTSGCLLVGKKPSIIKALQQRFREKSVEKTYLMLVHGKCKFTDKTINLPLERYLLASGERRVRVNQNGKEALTQLQTLQSFRKTSLLQATLLTGRTHQLRVHCQAIGHPIIGDTKYGNSEADQLMSALGHRRLFLHAATLSFMDPKTAERYTFCSTLDKEFAVMLAYLDSERALL